MVHFVWQASISFYYWIIIPSIVNVINGMYCTAFHKVTHLIKFMHFIVTCMHVFYCHNVNQLTNLIYVITYSLKFWRFWMPSYTPGCPYFSVLLMFFILINLKQNLNTQNNAIYVCLYTLCVSWIAEVTLKCCIGC